MTDPYADPYSDRYVHRPVVDLSAADTTTFGVSSLHGEVHGDVQDAGHPDAPGRGDRDGEDLGDGFEGEFEPRAYVLTRGRTKPDCELDMLSVLATTDIGATTRYAPPYDQMVELCSEPVSVAEVSAQMALPLTVTKILLSDLILLDAVVDRLPVFDEPKIYLMERVLDGLRRYTA